MSETIIKGRMHFSRGGRGRKILNDGEAPPPVPVKDRVPRVARLLALAHRFEKLIRDGVVKDYAELARLGHVSRPRVTQVMNLLNLAPDIQEQILFWPAIERGRDPIHTRSVRLLCAIPDWRKQREMWSAESALPLRP